LNDSNQGFSIQMAPKAKQQSQPAQPAQPKAKADPKAKAKAQPEAAKAPAPAPKAEPAPKADAKAKAKGKAKAEPASAQVPAVAAAKSQPAAEPKAKAKQGAKSQPAAAPAPAKAEPVAAPKSKSKAKGKAAPPPPPPPPPEPEPVEEEIAGKKKKTNHRGGRNKNKEVTGAFEEEDESPVVSASVQAQPKKKPGKSAAEIAGVAAEKDPELRALRDRFTSLNGAVEPSSTPATAAKARKVALETLLQDIDQEMVTKKVPPRPKSAANVSSLQLLQSLDDLKQMKDEGSKDMMEIVEKEVAEAKAFELWTALKTRLTELKGQCEDTLKAASAAPSSTNAGKGPAADRARPSEREQTESREAAILRRLCNLSKKDAKDVTGAMIETSKLELDLNITRYLFSPPHNFNSRFEQQFKVLVEPERGPKGGGKGGKGAPPPKDITITGLSAADVKECEAALKALDFSGTKTRDVENGLVMPSNTAKAALEKEFNVFVFKNQNQITVFGTSDQVGKALAKIEDEGFSKVITVGADLVKMIYSHDLLGKWRSAAAGASISVRQPPMVEGKGSQPAQITIHCKTKQETEDLYAKVEDFATNTASEVLAGDAAIIGKLFERSNGSWLAKRFREIQDASKDVSMKKSTDGLLLLGPKKQLGKIKAEVQGLLQKADIEPTKVSLDPDQLRVFTKDHLDKIRDTCGLMEMYKSKDQQADSTGTNVTLLVLLGDDASVAKAKLAIDEVIKNEGASETMEATDQVCKELLASKAAKIQDYQNMYSTYISVDRKTLSIKILGSTKGVEATKKAITTFAKKTDSVKSKTFPLAEEEIGRVIGSKGPH